MNNQDLMDQFARCEQWQDADQWDALGMLYFNHGFVLNAGVCFKRADARRQWDAFRDAVVAVETLFPELESAHG